MQDVGIMQSLKSTKCTIHHSDSICCRELREPSSNIATCHQWHDEVAVPLRASFFIICQHPQYIFMSHRTQCSKLSLETLLPSQMLCHSLHGNTVALPPSLENPCTLPPMPYPVVLSKSFGCLLNHSISNYSWTIHPVLIHGLELLFQFH